MQVGFIGFGKMANAIASSFEGKIIASDVNTEQLEEAKNSRVEAAESNTEVLQKADTIIIAVKPQDMNSVLEEISPAVSEKHLIISIAAGTPLSAIESKLTTARVVRVMPNIACLVGEAASAFALGSKATPADKETVEKIFSSCGKAIEVSEEQLHAVTALSGSGPAFAAEIIQAFAKAGEENGLGREDAFILALQTFLGTAKLLLEKDISPEELIEKVASKGGTTEAGLLVLQNSEFKKIVSETIYAAIQKSKELGK